MGISKDIELPTKVTTSYHRISGVGDIKWRKDGTGSINIIIEQYLSYEARLAGATPVNTEVKHFELDHDLTGIIRYMMYRAILPLDPSFDLAQTVQDGELGNMLRLLKYLNPAEMSAMIFALTDILNMLGVDPEDYLDWYNKLKEDTLSVI